MDIKDRIDALSEQKAKAALKNIVSTISVLQPCKAGANRYCPHWSNCRIVHGELCDNVWLDEALKGGAGMNVDRNEIIRKHAEARKRDETEAMRKYAEAHGCPADYPQDQEENEYRYLSPMWLDAIARGLTKGAVKHPGETWRTIPSREHAWRAIRHLVLFLLGDKKDNHLINASMRVMMAVETDAAVNSTIEWEKLMREKGCG